MERQRYLKRANMAVLKQVSTSESVHFASQALEWLGLFLETSQRTA